MEKVMAYADDHVIVVSTLAEQREAVKAFNTTIRVIERDKPERWQEIIEYLLNVRFRISSRR